MLASDEIGKQSTWPEATDHSTGSKIGTLFVLLAVSQKAVEGPNTVGYEIVSFKEIQVLPKISGGDVERREYQGTYIVVDADIDILASVLLFLDKACSEAPAAGIDDVAALFSLDGGMEAEVLATGQAQASEFLFVAQLLGAVLHEGLEFCQSLFDLGHGTGAVDKFPLLWIILLICDNERQKRDGLASSGGHFQDTVAACVKGSWEDMVSGFFSPGLGGTQGGV